MRLLTPYPYSPSPYSLTSYLLNSLILVFEFVGTQCIVSEEPPLGGPNKKWICLCIPTRLFVLLFSLFMLLLERLAR